MCVRVCVCACVRAALKAYVLCVLFTSDTPVIQTITQNQIVVATNGATLICRVDSFPEPDIDWIFNNSVIGPVNDLSASIKITRETGNNIHISTVNFTRTDPDSAGTYCCNATNERGSDMACTDLIFYGRLLILFTLVDSKQITKCM